MASEGEPLAWGGGRADRHHDGWPSRLRQDDNLRQASPISRKTIQGATARRRRHATTGGRRTATCAWRAAQASRLQRTWRVAGGHLCRCARRSEEARPRCNHLRHGGAAGYRRAPHGGSLAEESRPRQVPRMCSCGRRDDWAGCRANVEGLSRSALRLWRCPHQAGWRRTRRGGD